MSCVTGGQKFAEHRQSDATHMRQSGEFHEPTFVISVPDGPVSADPAIDENQVGVGQPSCQSRVMDDLTARFLAVQFPHRLDILVFCSMYLDIHYHLIGRSIRYRADITSSERPTRWAKGAGIPPLAVRAEAGSRLRTLTTVFTIAHRASRRQPLRTVARRPTATTERTSRLGSHQASC
jgi:hypothetical protein